MSAPARPPQWHEVVARHWRDTEGYVIAQSGACLDVRSAEAFGPLTRTTGRLFKPYRPNELARLLLPKSWFLGFILCPGDALDTIVDWVSRRRSEDRARVKFYMHPDFDQKLAEVALRPLLVRPDQVVDFSGSSENFHSLFGLDHAWQVWRDHGPR